MFATHIFKMPFSEEAATVQRTYGFNEQKKKRKPSFLYYLMLFLRLLLGMGRHNYDEYQPADVNSASAASFSHAKMQMCVSFSSLLPSFHFKLGSFLNSVVSRCPSDGDKENERGGWISSA